MHFLLLSTTKYQPFTGGTTPQISTLDNDYLFRCRASDSIFAEAAAAYAKELGCKKLGLFFNNDDFGTGAEGVIKQYCADNGMEYVEDITRETRTLLLRL